jgi:hypothetical protein
VTVLEVPSLVVAVVIAGAVALDDDDLRVVSMPVVAVVVEDLRGDDAADESAQRGPGFVACRGPSGPEGEAEDGNGQ